MYTGQEGKPVEYPGMENREVRSANPWTEQGGAVMGVFQDFLHFWAFFPSMPARSFHSGKFFCSGTDCFLCLNDFILPYGRA